ncbi:hypothetical protein AB9P05_18120 [Roseivirga sp. BDSF3-8]|uniref:hypothetical protein n=1 Tax=Roseivirga sp. BDSF3-8 TaxID=3241598 RepID=UPI0035324E17
MSKLTRLFLIGCLCITAGYPPAAAQSVGEYMGDESQLYAEVKQVNQFFRRFNGEEDTEGNRYYPRDREYRSEKLRKNYLTTLFDNQNVTIPKDRKLQFINEVAADGSPEFLDFHSGKWFAEVRITVNFEGRDQNATLFLSLQEESVGSKWVIEKAYFAPFEALFTADTTNERFLHPMSHELDFMNLNKAFRNREKVVDYTSRQYGPDHLSLMLYEVRKGNMSFKTVRGVDFHFFQLDNWYFKISEFNRSGYNRGWLISDLTRVTTKQAEVLRKLIYYEN